MTLKVFIRAKFDVAGTFNTFIEYKIKLHPWVKIYNFVVSN